MAFDLSEINFNYKYTKMMTPSKGTIYEIYDKISNKHNDRILNGIDQIMISAIPTDNWNFPYFNLVFDFDFKMYPALTLYQNAEFLIEKLHFMKYAIEISPEGFHLLFYSHIVVGESIKVYETYKKFLKFFKIDKVSSTNIPIYRVGSYRKETNITMIPVTISELKDIIFDREGFKKLYQKPFQIYDSNTWKMLWKQYLIPTNVIMADDFFKVFNIKEDK